MISKSRTLFRRTLAVALVMAAGGFGCRGCDRDPDKTVAAWLVEFDGPVRIDRDAGEAEGGSKDAPLYDGNVVSTGPAAKATVRYSDRTQITVGEKTRFRVGEKQGKLVLELESGTILSNSRQTGAGGLTIVTRYGQTKLLEGAELELSVTAEGQGSMKLLFGQIEMISEDGGAVSMMEGDTMDLALGTKSGSAVVAAVDAGVPAGAETILESLPMQLVFSAAKGKPMIRAAGAKAFSVAGAEAKTITAGSDFKVPAGAAALLSGKGLVGRLGPGTSGQIGEAKLIGGEAETYGLQLDTGAADLEFTNRAARKVTVNSRGRQILLESKDLGGITLAVGKSGVDFTVRAGEVKVTSGEETVTVGTGERVSLAGTKFRTPFKLQPALVLPHSRLVRVYADRLEEIGLELPKSEQPLRVEVARDNEFNERVLSGMVAAQHVTVPAPKAGDLFWRAFGADDAEVARGRARFTHDKGAVVNLDNPHAEVAETGLKASVLFQSELPSLSFSFTPKQGAAAYRVRVYKADDLKKPLAEKVVKETRANFDAGSIPEGQFLWNAAPLDAAGGELSGGRMNKLELVYDNSRTTLAISRPRPGESGGAGGVPVAGIAPIGAKLYINGKPAPLGAKGRFSLNVPKADKLVFRLVDDGREGYWVRHLRSKGAKQ